MDPEVGRAALRYVEQHLPAAELVVVAGSAARERRPRSDIDLLVIGPATMFDGDAEEAAHTDRFEGELFEVFAATEDAFRRHVRAGEDRFRPVSAFLLLDGVAVLDRGTTDDLREWTLASVAAGPQPTPAELAGRRYAVTNTLDDLLDASDAAETAVLAGMLFVRLGELVLLANGTWIASGRHLLGRLRELDRPWADAVGVALATRDVNALERLTLQALEPFGGRLLEGFVR